MKLRLPWLPFRLIDELQLSLGQGARVFEYGGGGSTLWFLDRGATVVTVEHHPDWARALHEAVGSSARGGAWTLLQPVTDAGFDAYVDAIRAYRDGEFDLVVVDGRERGRCAHAALDKIRPGGLLVVDDVDRERYVEPLAAITWPRRDVVGFAPAKPSLAYTAVFQRPADD
jgi:predicted O-methyltransferase YrrM